MGKKYSLSLATVKLAATERLLIGASQPFTTQPEYTSAADVLQPFEAIWPGAKRHSNCNIHLVIKPTLLRTTTGGLIFRSKLYGSRIGIFDE